MEKFWKLCEIEEYVRSFIELSVAAVPEIWIIKLDDGSYICYWPKKDASKKIRKFASFEDGGEWTSYKCRILLKGEKFSSYKEARQAEKDAQNMSCTLNNTQALNSTMDYDMSDNDSSDDKMVGDKGSDHKAQKCGKHSAKHNSTMDFDITDIADKIVDVVGNDISELNSTMDFHVYDEDEEDGEIVGNDTTEFNMAVLRGGSYCSNEIQMTDLEQDCRSSSGCDDWLRCKPGTTLSGYTSVSCSSDEAGYSHFGSCNDFLTSTAIGDINSVMNTESEALLSNIKALESAISVFYQDVKTDLQQIKQILNRKSESMNNGEDQTTENPVSLPIWTANQAIDEIVSVDDLDGKRSPTHCSKDQSNLNSMPIWVDINTNQSNAINEIIFLGESEENIPAIPELPAPLPVSIHDEENVCTSNETFVLPKELKMKVVGKKQFRGNEDLLELDEEMQKEMVERLSPFNNEDEAAYIKRTVDLLFDEPFFLDEITWKIEKKRQCIKHSNLLKYWKVSFEKKFGPDPLNTRYMAHFRRLKNTKRAAIKAAAAMLAEVASAQNK